MTRARVTRPSVRLSRPALALGTLAAVLALVAGTAVTHAAFTDTAVADLGTVGGSYDIAFLDGDGTLVEGNPSPMVVDTVVPGHGGAPAIEVDAVTTTAVTGPVQLSLVNGRDTPLPTDPGMTGPGADPFDVARFTVSVDGEVLVTGHDPAAGPITITDWQPGVAKRIQVSVTLTPALGNPYYYGRAMVLALHLDGSTA